MTQKELDKRVNALMALFDDVNAFFIAKVAAQVLKVGKLIPSTMEVISVMADMNEDIAAINRKLANALKLALPDLYKLYQDAMASHYTDPRFVRALKETPLSGASKARMEHYAEAVSRQTAGTMVNLSNTTIASETYRRTVDNAILAVSSGLTDYRSATRQSIRDLGYNGMQVQYPGGYHRRLDTAVRQNIIDGVNQIAQQGSIMMGEELGYDAYELSAHLRSAPDHEPIQGRVFLKEEFDKLQSQQPFEDVDGNHYGAIRRPIGEWNCMHIAMAFSTKYSKRQYPDSLLKKWADDNKKGCTIDGKHYTTYEASQLMRKIETQIRREKDTANVARIAGDDVLRAECQDRINALARKYREVANAAGLQMRKERTTVEGFRMVKTGSKEYDNYKSVLGKDAPETYREFQDIKNQGGEKWKLMKLDYSRRKELIDNPDRGLPNAKDVYLPDEKFTKYLFNAENPKGYAKGIAFESRLGYNKDNWKLLQSEIRERAEIYPASNIGDKGYGDVYEQRMIIYGLKDIPANVIVGWLHRLNGSVAMTTAYITEVKHES